MPCPLCEKPEDALYACADFYVIDAHDPDYPGYVRIVAARHVKEMTDLSEKEAQVFFLALLTAEKTMREAFAPDKVNLAEFGNMAPHLHWHVIPRFKDDPHFPNSVWGERVRANNVKALQKRREAAEKYFAALKKALRERFG